MLDRVAYVDVQQFEFQLFLRTADKYDPVGVRSVELSESCFCCEVIQALRAKFGPLYFTDSAPPDIDSPYHFAVVPEVNTRIIPKVVRVFLLLLR